MVAGPRCVVLPLTPGVLTVDAGYAGPIGLADLQYQGDAVPARFEVPREALDFASRAIDEP